MAPGAFAVRGKGKKLVCGRRLRGTCIAANLLHMEAMAFPCKMCFLSCVSCTDDDESQRASPQHTHIHTHTDTLHTPTKSLSLPLPFCPSRQRNGKQTPGKGTRSHPAALLSFFLSHFVFSVSSAEHFIGTV